MLEIIEIGLPVITLSVVFLVLWSITATEARKLFVFLEVWQEIAIAIGCLIFLPIAIILVGVLKYVQHVNKSRNSW